jgi:hypothetical protein
MRDAIQRTLLYFDVFHWPLSRAELVRYVAPGDPAAVEAACDELIGEGWVCEDGGWLFLAGEDDSVAARRSASRHAERSWRAASRAAAVLARFPYVRGVLITGGLSKGASAPDADVDFLLLIAPGRVWLAKTLLQAWRRTLPPRIRECFCTNYLLSSDALALDDRNAYTAIELATAIPMYDGDTCGRLLDENRWGQRYVPGWDWAVERARNAPQLPERRAAVAFERMTASKRLDARALSLWDAYWNRKYGWLDDATRAQRFKRRPDVATNHLHDFQFRVLAAFEARLHEHGVSNFP